MAVVVLLLEMGSWQNMAAVGATDLWYESQPMLLLLGLVLVGSAYAGWRESCELFWATCAFLAGSACPHDISAGL